MLKQCSLALTRRSQKTQTSSTRTVSSVRLVNTTNSPFRTWNESSLRCKCQQQKNPYSRRILGHRTHGSKLKIYVSMKQFNASKTTCWNARSRTPPIIKQLMRLRYSWSHLSKSTPTIVIAFSRGNREFSRAINLQRHDFDQILASLITSHKWATYEPNTQNLTCSNELHIVYEGISTLMSSRKGFPQS